MTQKLRHTGGSGSLSVWLMAPLFGLLFACSEGASPTALPSVIYALKADRDLSSLSIMLEVPPQPTGRLRLELPPDRFGAATGLAKAISWGETRNADLEISEEGSHAELIFHEPEKKAQLYYRLEQLYAGPPHDRLRVFWPSIQPDYWYFSSTTALIAPLLPKPFSVTLQFESPPEATDWNLASSVGVRTECPTRCQVDFQVESGQALHADVSEALIFTFGRTTIRPITLFADDETRRNELYISLYGLPEYVEDENDLLDALVQIVQSHQTFWLDRGHPHFVISLIGFENTQPNNFGGFNAKGIFTSFVPRHAMEKEWASGNQALPRTDWPGLLSHVSHEYGHTWIRPDLVNTEKENPEDFGWLLEGVTEYRADQALLHTGLINMEDYAKRLNLKLGRYDGAFRNSRDESLEAIKAGFWTGDYGLQRQPYLRGNLLAHNWNARIIQASNREDNFDSLLKDWVGASRENGIDSHQIEALSRAFLDAGVMGDVRRHWLEGEVIEVDSDALGPCFALQEDEGIRQFQRQPEIALAEWNQRCNGPAPGWVIPQAEPSP